MPKKGCGEERSWPSDRSWRRILPVEYTPCFSSFQLHAKAGNHRNETETETETGENRADSSALEYDCNPSPDLLLGRETREIQDASRGTDRFSRELCWVLVFVACRVLVVVPFGFLSMDEDQEQKHCCKFCKKTFPCGRSLGGHMRSHMAANPAEADDQLQGRKKAAADGGARSSSGGHEGGAHVGYGLRENPKKTWRVTDLIDGGNGEGSIRRGKVCKECGKGFQSWKALFGHMRCHATMEKLQHQDLADEDDSSGSINGARKAVVDSHSDNEGGPLPGKAKQGRRLRRAKYSSSASEVEQEQEDVAICLMMLSRDVWSWDELNSVVEYSENGSVGLEVQSLRVGKGIIQKDEDLVHNGNKGEKMKNQSDDASDTEISQFKLKRSESLGILGSDSLIVRAKKAESDVSDDQSNNELAGKHAQFEASVEKLGENGCKKDKYGYSDVELRRGPWERKLNGTVTELSSKDFDKMKRSGECDLDARKCGSSKRARSNAYNTELSWKKMKSEASENEPGKNRCKKSRFECTTCNKTFHSYQALGGHRASHKRVKGCFASKIESSENSIETDVSPDQIADNKLKSCRIENMTDPGEVADTTNVRKNVKAYECPVCLKVFSSGQALGGHKRSHMIGSADSRSEAGQITTTQQNLAEVSDMLDLNLPAPVDEDSIGHVRFNPWWAAGNQSHEQMVGLISN
ncbi:hypothetical protein ACLOJK_038494 [Asimina triloba]